MTATTTATAAATTTTTTEQPKQQLPLAVDRQWLQKLLQRHHHAMPALVLAPMVDQSDLPFRLLTRRYGCHLCFTPMIHCGLFARSPEYRSKFSLANLPPADRPLVAQLCGSQIESVLYTALAVAPYCDAIDINCGCPQGIARRGNYGAFLLEQPDTLLRLIRALVQKVPVPVTAKVRLLPAATPEESVQTSLHLYTQLVQAGVHMLTIHGRTRDQKGPLTGPADWPAIRRIVQALGHCIPILANGSVASRQDVIDCLRETQADGVMCSEAILEYPALFASVGDISNHNNNNMLSVAAEPPRTIGRVALAREYLQLARQYPPHMGGQGSTFKCIRTHVHRILHADLQDCTSLRQRIINVETWQELWDAVEWLAQQHAATGHEIPKEQLSWYVRHRMIVRDSVSGMSRNVGQVRKTNETAMKSAELEEDTAECLGCLFENDQEEY